MRILTFTFSHKISNTSQQQFFSECTMNEVSRSKLRAQLVTHPHRHRSCAYSPARHARFSMRCCVQQRIQDFVSWVDPRTQSTGQERKKGCLKFGEGKHFCRVPDVPKIIWKSKKINSVVENFTPVLQWTRCAIPCNNLTRAKYIHTAPVADTVWLRKGAFHTGEHHFGPRACRVTCTNRVVLFQVYSKGCCARRTVGKVRKKRVQYEGSLFHTGFLTLSMPCVGP